MNLYLRLLIALCHTLRTPVNHTADLACTFRVWPHDLDAFGHMNNGRYLQIMDVARVRWMARTGVLGAMLRQRWSGIIGGSLTRYRHSLRPFQRYRVRTRLAHWDDRWFYFEHTFLDAHDRCVAAGLSRVALRRQGGWVTTDEAVRQVIPGARPPEPPPYLAAWLALDQAVFEHQESLGNRAVAAPAENLA